MTPDPVSPKSSRARTLLKYGLSAGIAGLFLYLAFRGTNFDELFVSLREANYLWLILGFLFMLTSHVVRALRWRYMLEPVKSKIALRNLFSGVMVGYMMNNILPRAGELARPYTVGKLENLPKSAAFGTIVVERIIDILSFLVIVAAIPLLYQGPLKESFPWLESTGNTVAAIALGLLGLMIVLILRRNWANAFLRFFLRMLPARLAERLEKMSHAFLDGLLFLTRPGRFLPILALTLLIWFLYAMTMYVSFYGFGLEGLGFRAAMLLLAMSSIGIALPTPGGTGTYHVLISQSLTRLYAVDHATALSFATASHAVSYIGVTLLGLYYFLRDNIRVSQAVHVPEGESEFRTAPGEETGVPGEEHRA
ncbi:MAG: flippase-like domain-containing protein [Bacteroidetes bacterium]|nr:flippase-like domain-containing protein [Bacteroidota bacterium]